MEALFGRDGSVVGWLHPENVMFDGSRHCRAFVQDDVIYGQDGRYLGGFYRGFVYDQRGSAVAFVHGASGGPLRPATKLVPLAPVLRLPRYGHPPRLVPARQKACREWSSESFDAFLDGEDDTEDFAYNGGRRRDGAGL
jgi:hypothetical protein